MKQKIKIAGPPNMARTAIRAEIPRMIEQVWYGLVHQSMAGTALIDYGCRLRDQRHPFAPAVFSFGVLLQDTLQELGLYNQASFPRQYHFPRRHGRDAIIVSYVPPKEV